MQMREQAIIVTIGEGKELTYVISPQKHMSQCIVKSTKMTWVLKEDLDLPQFMHETCV